MTRSILILDQFSDLGGAQWCLLDLLPAFLNAGYSLHLAIPGDGPLAERARHAGAHLHHIPSGPYAPGRKTWMDVARFTCDFPRQFSVITHLLLRHRIDLVYVNGPRLLPAAAASAAGRPVIFHAHSIVNGRTARRLTRWAIRSASAHVIAVCRFVLASLALPSFERTRVIYNGIAPLNTAPERRTHTKPWRVGVIGRIAPEKGQLEFIQAARMVQQRRRCQFIVCGDALIADPRYSSRVKAEAVGLPVTFLGWRDNVREVLSELDVLVVPSATIEATTRVIPEAFSAGVPVVAFRSGGIPEIVDDRITGVLCSATAQDLAETLVDVFADDGLFLRCVAARAKAAFQSRFSLDRYRAQVLDVVQHAIA